MKGLFQYIIIGILIVALIGTGIVLYTHFSKKDITSFISDDLEYGLYIKTYNKWISEYLTKGNKTNIYFEELLLGGKGKEETFVVLKGASEETKRYFEESNNTYKREINGYTIYCSSEEICDLVERNYKNPKPSKLRDLLRKEGDIIFAVKTIQENYGKIEGYLSLIIENENVVDISGKFEFQNESIAKEIKKYVDAIVGFIALYNIEGVDIITNIEGNKIKVSGTIDFQKINESIKNMNLSMELLKTPA